MPSAKATATAALGLTALLVVGPAPAAFAADPDTHVLSTAAVKEVDYGTWRRDVAAVVAEARPYIEARAENAGRQKQAIVLDIDNSSLETDFHPFWELPTPAIADVRDLVREAHARGVAVFFVTARPGIIHSLTDWNLKQVGYPVDGLYVRSLPDLFSEVSAYKTEKRAEIEAKGYTIIANIGNNTTDLVGGHAERTFKLPDYGGKLS
ncbi:MULTISPECIES: HAD family acid phosphatase [unclassified Streptomyces]|uniref:HAD family acid phosphatase n=1 Tax=unclassified Streptomyces TaxID=2593676 RepID=UPI0006FAAC48|nr:MULTISPECIES: HAD family acid phosphatase [unclassified Streptomyces]KQX58859.1 hydrolase [Streptomyces sp. Root1304]KRB00120.1 hydrolase [Streptomyces sp. Root66D1]